MGALMILNIHWISLNRMGRTRCQPNAIVLLKLFNCIMNKNILDVCPAEHHTIQRAGCLGAGVTLHREITML